MTRHIKLSILALLAAAAAFPAAGAADHDRRAGRWTKLGEVGTHRHDAEDFVTVPTRRLFDRISVRAFGHPVPLDGVQFHFADGTTEYATIRTHLTGRGLVIEVPHYGSPLKMLVLDYGNTGPFFRDREDARVEVLGMSDERYYRERYDRPYERPAYRYRQPAYEREGRWQLRGGMWIRIR